MTRSHQGWRQRAWRIVRPAAVAAGYLPLVLAVACGGSSRHAVSSRTSPSPNIVLVTIDTFRADRLTADVAPNLERLADRGVRFTAARSAVPLTLPSHTTILTGLLPPAHGVRENGVAPLGDNHPTIARLLKEHGYATAAFVGAFVLDRRFGLARGFDTYDDRIPRDPNATERLEAERPASAVVDSALAWLPPSPAASSNPRNPFFMWIHLYDPHAPYVDHDRSASNERPAPSNQRQATSNQQPATSSQRPATGNQPRETSPEPRGASPEPREASNEQRYDGEVSYADAQIARVFDRLRDLGVLDRTLIVIAGDHGEGLGDHGERTHGMLLYDSTLRVPLAIAGPGIQPARRDDAVSLADIAPTILRAAGMTPPGDMKGRDLLDAGANRDPEAYAETEYPRVAGWSPLQALTDGRWKTIRAGDATEIYDVRNDPHETNNLARTQQTTAAGMGARIDAIRASGSPAAATSVSAEAQERLRALGYVASSVQPQGSRGGANPASEIATWNAFEEALSLLNARPSDAVSPLSRLAAAHPDAEVFHTTYARALADSGRTADALDAYRRAAKKWPTDATLLHDLAVAAREAAGRKEGAAAAALQREAIDADRAAIALAPSSATAHNGLGLLAADQDRPADAVREFAQAADLDPNNASYWANLGNAKRAAGDAAGADQAYRKALDLDARSADAANGLGVLLVEAHRPEEAARWFERALAASPNFVEARLNLGIALQQSGDMKRAAETYRTVLAAGGSHPREKDAARHLLAALGGSR